MTNHDLPVLIEKLLNHTARRGIQSRNADFAGEFSGGLFGGFRRFEPRFGALQAQGLVVPHGILEIAFQFI